MPAHTVRLLGNLLVAVGVLAWAPFFYLLAGGTPPGIAPFLATHLTGVLSGAWLRRKANEMEGLRPQQVGAGRARLSTILIFLGVLAWAPYLYNERVLGQDMPLTPFLIAHLSGVVPGTLLRVSVELERHRQRRRVADQK